MKIKLYCLPYAGGSSKVYSKWIDFLSNKVEFMPIELAGRGSRIFDQKYSSREEAIEDVISMIKNDILKSPYIVFGHSLGALLAYELVQRINELKLPQPLHVFLSGSGAPHLRTIKKYHLLDGENFKKEVLKLGGTPPEFFEHSELMEIFLPLLKNDFKLASLPWRKKEKLNQEITVFHGTKDMLTKGKVKEWEQYTNGKCNFFEFNGGHFFLNDFQKEMVKIINSVAERHIVFSSK